MEKLAGFDVYPVEFTREGEIFKPAQATEVTTAVAQGITDLLVLSHGWNNDMRDAHDNLYAPLLTSMRTLIDSGKHPLTKRKVAVLAVYWPSKKFAEEDLIPGGAAGINDKQPTVDVVLRTRLDALKAAFNGKDGFGSPKDDDAVATIEHLKALIPDLERDERKQDEFGRLARSLFPADVNDEEQVLLDDFQTMDGDELLTRLSRPFNPRVLSTGGAAGSAGPNALRMPTTGGAVGLGNVFSGIKNGALNLLNLFTYYEMKSRAGVVGTAGVHSLLRKLQQAAPTLRLHLAGHSFGGRVISAAISAGEDADAICVNSIALLQAAFSHWGFAQDYEPNKNGLFRVGLENVRLKGPMIVTHTVNDKCVGLAYPIASRLRKQVASGIGDENDPYGGIGRNGALKTPEVDVSHAQLLDVGQVYAQFNIGGVCNLEASQFIKGHGDVHGPQVAHAILSAVEAT
jgi:hypothetical protein